MADKETDITVYGATSFVAKHVLRYLIEVASKDPVILLSGGTGTGTKTDKQKQSSFRVTLAGRNRAKLNALRESLINDCNESDGKKVVQSLISDNAIVADGSDLPALQVMTKRSIVVLNCAGPYAKYSSKVVQACATTGTDYVDITAEVSWVSEMRELYGADAAKSGARIVPLCGYDSIPSDLAVYHAIQTLRGGRDGGVSPSSSPTKTTIQIQHARIWYQAYGMANGGTIATAADLPIDLVNDFTTTTADDDNGGGDDDNNKSTDGGTSLLVKLQSKQLRSVPYLLGDPLCLAHPSKVRQNPEFDTTKNRMAVAEWMNQLLAIEKEMFYGISMPFFMSVVNLKVVHASAVALGYGDNFTAHERMFPMGFTVAKVLSIMALFPVAIFQCCIVLMMSTLYLPVIGPRIAGLMPPGTGVSDGLCAVGSNTVYCLVKGTDPNSDDGKIFSAYSYFRYQGDAGNFVTAQCVSEAALALVLNRDELPKRSEDGFGTPAELLGGALLKRFKDTKARPITIKSSVDAPLI